MSVLWRKVWFDLWHHKGRSLLAILSIAAGVLAIGVIFGLVDQLLVGMDRAHQAVAPSHINVILRDLVNQEVVDELLDIPGVVDIDPVNQVSVHYKTSSEEKWKLGTLVMRSDYDRQTYDRVELKEGEWPRDEKIGIERLSSQYYAVDLGEQVIFDVSGEERAFDINGKIRHPFVQPPPFGGQAHFFTDAAGMALFGIPEGWYNQLLVRVEPYSRSYAQEVAGDIRSRLGEQGFAVVVTLYQDPEKHWGRMFVEGVTVVLQLIALVSLFLSVLLVMNTLMALITQQTDQIGAIKAVGGRQVTIIKVYLAGVVVFGLLALLIALLPGVLIAYQITYSFLNLFNIDYGVFQVSQRAIVLQVLAALLAPLLAALWPVLRGSAITVREAIASYGLGADFGSNRLDRAIERAGARFLPPSYAAALGNMFRRKGRLVLTLLVLTTAGVMFLVVMSLVSSIDLTLDNEISRRGYDVRIGFAQEQPAQEVLELARTLPEVQEAETWYSRNALILRQGERVQDSAGLGAQLIGLPESTQMYRPLIAQGRWLEPGDEQVIVINQETAAMNDIAIGDQVNLDLGNLAEQSWQVIGTYKVLYDTGFVVEPIYAPIEAVYTAIQKSGVSTQVLVRTGSETLAEAKEIADKLSEVYESQQMDIDFYTTTITLQERDYASSQFKTVTSVLLNLAMLMGMVGGIGLMGSLGISVVERRREIGVLRAIGARSRSILGIFVMEGVFQGILSWLVAVPVAFLVGQPVAQLLGQTMLEVDLDYAFNSQAVAAWLVVSLVLSILFSILPARSATRVSVRESLAYA